MWRIGNIFAPRQTVTPVMLAESNIAAPQMSHQQFHKKLSDKFKVPEVEKVSEGGPSQKKKKILLIR